jgi:hypothetical protein
MPFLNFGHSKNGSELDQYKSNTNVRSDTKPQSINMFALNLCFGKDGTCVNPVISGTNRCKSCTTATTATTATATTTTATTTDAKQVTSAQTINNKTYALDVLRKMGNSIPSYCERCNNVGMFGMKCICGGYFMPK